MAFVYRKTRIRIDEWVRGRSILKAALAGLALGDAFGDAPGDNSGKGSIGRDTYEQNALLQINQQTNQQRKLGNTWMNLL
jgi:hypothetical protein